MPGNLAEVLDALLGAALPRVFGDQNAVTVTIASDLFEMDAGSGDAMASEPRAEDRTDTLPFDPANPAGPYELTQPPYPGPRKVSLVSRDGDRIPLRDTEVVVDEAASRRFTLALRPNRDEGDITGVMVLYAVTAVFTRVTLVETLNVQLESQDPAKLREAEALAIAVIELNRTHFTDAARVTFEDGDYGADVHVKGVTLLRGTAPSATERLLALRAEIELRARRALRDDEGRPITSIRSPGRPPGSDRRVDIDVELNA
jgi:hypothetical protein